MTIAHQITNIDRALGFVAALHEADRLAVERDQDWQDEATVFTFEDGSTLKACYPHVQVLDAAADRQIVLTIDQQSLGEEWPHVEAYCRLLRAAIEEHLLREDFSGVQVSVQPERDSFNGGRLSFSGSWDNLRQADFLRELIQHLQSDIYISDKWLPTHNGSKS